jgi:hypothetical protein
LNKHFQSGSNYFRNTKPNCEVYDFIIQDLKDAIQSLPAGPKSAVYYRERLLQLQQTCIGKSVPGTCRIFCKKAYRLPGRLQHSNGYYQQQVRLQLALLPDFGKVVF